MNVINMEEYLYPIFIVNNHKIDRFVGSSFFINRKGDFITCKHLKDDLKQGEYLALYDFINKKACPVENILHHPQKDFCVGKVHINSYKILTFYEGQINLGMDIRTVGFTYCGNPSGVPRIEPRLLKGYIVRYSSIPDKEWANSTCELSFPAYKGFCGSPVLTINDELIGMIYGSNISKYSEHTIIESTENGKTKIEKQFSIIDFALIHTPEDIKLFLNDLDKN
ncbi:serine protease [bacterium]|nr:serine protease [bacterium]